MNRMRLLVALLIASSLVIANASEPQPLAPSPSPPNGARTTILISDLHLGIGRMVASENPLKEDWHPMEDFRWPNEFDAFLRNVEDRWTRKEKPVDLVILGDFLELWQSPLPDQRDCVYDRQGKPIVGASGPFLDLVGVQANLSCNVGDALARAYRVLAAHDGVLKRIGRFASMGDNRVTIVPGNHDAALNFTVVEQETLRVIAAEAGRVRVAKEGYWRSADGLVFAEHGHFIEGDVNDYSRFPAACLDVDGAQVPCDRAEGKTFLERPWGEKFVQDYYDRYEQHFPIVDNITSEAAAVTEAIAASSGAERLNAIGRALRFLLLQQSLRQLGQLLGPAEEKPVGAAPSSRWDLKTINSKGETFFAESLAESNPLRADVAQLVSEGKLGIALADLDDAEIIRICDQRAALRKSATDPRAAPQDCPSSDETLGAVKSRLLTTYPQRLARRMDTVRGILPNDRPSNDFKVYVYAHTHAAHQACSAHEAAGKTSATKEGTPWVPKAFNTGAWQRVVSPRRLDEMKAEKPSKPLADYRPEDLPACFSMVVIGPGKDFPEAKTWFWALKGNYWNFYANCPEDQWQLPSNPCLK
jgi:UDP-2,3-diacylglucosamine pyrophosphatase LpxH